MQRSLIMIALMVLAAVPAATAHDPPRPVIDCQPIGGAKEHDYWPPNTGNVVLGGDGNIWGPPECPKASEVEIGLGVCIPPADTLLFVCEPFGTGMNQPILQYDGELDYGHGGVFLFYHGNRFDSGDTGVTLCFGWPSVGHHAGAIYALDVSNNGPQFTVTSDYSRAEVAEVPDCGDNYVEPCDPLPPVPSTLPFPANVVVDTVNDLLYLVFGPGGAGCNPLDNAARADAVVGGASKWPGGFGPGADGTLVVFIEQDTNGAVLATAGHVWTN